LAAARARFSDISGAGGALAPKSAEVRVMAIGVAAVAASLHRAVSSEY
jgi:hypothetical protein